MERRALVFFICAAVICSGCAMEAAPPRQYGAESAPVAEESAELPSSHGPIGRTHRAMRPVEEVFRSVTPLREARRFTLSELKVITRVSRFVPVAVSECDLVIALSF